MNNYRITLISVGSFSSSVCERGVEWIFPLVLVPYLKLGAPGRYTRVRLGMSTSHFRAGGSHFQE